MKSKTILISMIFMFLGLAQASAQEVQANDILGKWLNEDEDAQIDVYEENGKFYGKIIWLLNPIDEETGKPKLDDENPDEELQKRPVMGLLLLKDFVFDEDEWEDGTIYDPKNGKEYDCYIKFKEKDLLKIRGYIGITLLGRTTYWTRVND